MTYNVIAHQRVHIGSSVLIYEIDKKNNRIVLLDFEHHDTVYK